MITHKIVLASFVGIISVSFASIFIKECADVPSIVLSMYRLDFAAIFMIIINIVNRSKIFPLTKDEFLWGSIGGIFLALHFFFWIASLKYTSIASSVVLLSTNPFFVVLISLFFKDKISKNIILAMIFSFIGTIIITFSDGNLFGKRIDHIALFGDFLALMGALMVSIYFLVGAHLRKTVSTSRYVTIVYTASAVFISLLVPFFNVNIVHYSAKDFYFILLLAIVPQLIGHSAFNWVLKYLKSSAVAVTTLGEIVGTSILAYLVFHQLIDFYQFIGICFVVLAILVSFKYGKV